MRNQSCGKARRAGMQHKSRRRTGSARDRSLAAPRGGPPSSCRRTLTHCCEPHGCDTKACVGGIVVWISWSGNGDAATKGAAGVGRRTARPLSHEGSLPPKVPGSPNPWCCMPKCRVVMTCCTAPHYTPRAIEPAGSQLCAEDSGEWGIRSPSIGAAEQDRLAGRRAATCNAQTPAGMRNRRGRESKQKLNRVRRSSSAELLEIVLFARDAKRVLLLTLRRVLKTLRTTLLPACGLTVRRADSRMHVTPRAVHFELPHLVLLSFTARTCLLGY